MNEVLFKRPVKNGDHVRIYGKVENIGTSSLGVRVEARRFDFEKDLEEIVCSTQVVYVKIDENGKAVPIDQRLRESMELHSMTNLTERL